MNRLLIAFVGREMAWKVHAIVQNTNDQDTRRVLFEEDTVTATHSHAEAWSEIGALTTDDGTCDNRLHGVTQISDVANGTF